MKSSVWIGALALLLGCWAGALVGQQTQWRPAARPDGRDARNSTATLGKPVPLVRGARPDAEPIRTVPYQTVYGSSPVRTIATVPTPGTIIATAGTTFPPTTTPAPQRLPEEIDDMAGDQFATDRTLRRVSYDQPRPVQLPNPNPVQLPHSSPVPEDKPAGNWVPEPYPVNQPPPPAGPPPLDVPFGNEIPPASCYVQAEYLLWGMKPYRVPPLITTGPVSDGRDAGALGRLGTSTLFEGNLANGGRSGIRLTAGLWLDDCTEKAFEVSGFYLGQQNDKFMINSGQSPILARPFFAGNANLQSDITELVAFPGQIAGRITIDAPSDLWGIEANYRCKWCCGCNYRINALAGVRYLNLDERLTITEELQSIPGTQSPLGADRAMAVDSFATRNRFFGGQVGIEGRYMHGRFTLDGRAKFALGNTNQEITILGNQRFVNPTVPIDPRPGGLLALDSNIGTFKRDVFSFVPEIGLTLGYYVTENLRVSLGYNALFWTGVVRPGDQIDTTLDVTRIPNFRNVPAGTAPIVPPRPAVPFKESDLWVHGLTVGLELTF